MHQQLKLNVLYVQSTFNTDSLDRGNFQDDLIFLGLMVETIHHIAIVFWKQFHSISLHFLSPLLGCLHFQAVWRFIVFQGKPCWDTYHRRVTLPWILAVASGFFFFLKLGKQAGLTLEGTKCELLEQDPGLFPYICRKYSHDCLHASGSFAPCKSNAFFGHW